MFRVQRCLLLILSTAALWVPAKAVGPLAAVEKRAGGRLGVLALDTGTGRTLSYRADERFPLCSTFKLLLAAQVLQRVDAGKESLDRVLPFGPGDLLEHAPVTASHVGEKGMAIGALCAAALAQSDNTAANLLLAAMGGPRAFTLFVRSLGDKVTRLDRIEPFLNRPSPGQSLDSTSPKAMVATLRKILLGDTLSKSSREQLEQWLLASTTGSGTLKAGIPAHWRIAAKTGKGGNGATNEIGILYPPGRLPILVAAYSCGSKRSPAERDAVLAEVGRQVVASLHGR